MELQQADEAREKILASACRLFSLHGYENTSLSHVAREAKVSKALIFWHFDTKENLFQIALRKSLEPFFISVDQMDGLDERAQISMVIDDFYDFVRDNVYTVRFFLSLVVRDDKQPGDILARVNELYGLFRNLIADIIERGRRNRIFIGANVASPTLEAALIMSTLAGVLVLHFSNNESPFDAKMLLEHLKTTVFQRLGA